MALSEKKLASNKKYDQKNFKYYSIKFKKEEYEKLVQYCTENGLPINGFMRDVIMKAIDEKEN